MTTLLARSSLRREEEAAPGKEPWGWEAGILCAIGLVIPIALAVHYGSLSTPSNDDWAYDLAAFHLAQTGRFFLFHWGTISLLGQLVLALPALITFGDHIAVLNVWNCVVGTGGLFATVAVGRNLGLSRNKALLAGVTVGLGPTWAVLSTSFMTDVASYSCMMASLALATGDRCAGRLLTRRSAAALALALLAFTIRQPDGAMALAAIALWRPLAVHPRDRGQLRAWAVAVLALFTTAALFSVWRTHDVGGAVEIPARLDLTALWVYMGSWVLPLLGLMMAPAVACSRPAAIVRQAWRTSRAGTAIVWMIVPGVPTIFLVRRLSLALHYGGVSTSVLSATAPPLGNEYFDLAGVDIGPHMPYLPWPLVYGLWAAGIAALTVASGAAVSAAARMLGTQRAGAGGSRSWLAGGMLAAIGGGNLALLAFIAATNRPVWDRYLLPSAGTFAILLLTRAPFREVGTPRRRPAQLLPALALVSVAAAALVATIGSDGYDGAQWKYSTEFAAAHPRTPAADIGSDWMWLSYHMRYASPLGNEPFGTQCYLLVLDTPDRAGLLDYRTGGSFVGRYRFTMQPTAETGTAACRR